jgi:hypothetical protein
VIFLIKLIINRKDRKETQNILRLFACFAVNRKKDMTEDKTEKIDT